MNQWGATEITLVIGALGTMLVTVIAAISAAFLANRASNDSHLANTKADTIIGKAVEIHTLTNSNLSAVTKTLEVAQQKIAGLESMVSEMVKTRDAAAHATDASTLERVLTSGTVSPPAIPRTPDDRSGDAAEASLTKIESHTASIDTNTKRTDDTVQELKKDDPR